MICRKLYHDISVKRTEEIQTVPKKYLACAFLNTCSAYARFLFLILALIDTIVKWHNADTACRIKHRSITQSILADLEEKF